MVAMLFATPQLLGNKDANRTDRAPLAFDCQRGSELVRCFFDLSNCDCLTGSSRRLLFAGLRMAHTTDFKFQLYAGFRIDIICIREEIFHWADTGCNFDLGVLSEIQIDKSKQRIVVSSTDGNAVGFDAFGTTPAKFYLIVFLGFTFQHRRNHPFVLDIDHCFC